MNAATPEPAKTNDLVLDVRGLSVVFESIDGRTDAVRDVSFTLPRGRTLALVGESGSGKSTVGNAILRLIQHPGRIDAGEVWLRTKPGDDPLDLAALPEDDDRLFAVRGGQISMIFQEPMTALSPVHTIGNQLREAIALHVTKDRKAGEALAVKMMAKVGIPEPRARLKQYPFEFSGGMRQRVVIAMALVSRPAMVIADEPTTALDVTVQAQILRLINDLKAELGTSVLFVTHDLGVVAQVADALAVMKQGRIVERANVRDLFHRPYHPYTRRLLAAVPHAGFEDHGKRLLETMETPPGMPAGMGYDQPADVSNATPTRFRFGDQREVLLWPATAPAAEVAT
ncbi:MAG: ABC transporter ATP-binding protein [Planctomycetota bacterium]